MMFFEIEESHLTLKEIKHIAQALLDNKLVFNQLTSEQYEALAYIITPTLAQDQNETNIRARWQQLLDTFVIKGEANQPMRFYQDETLGRIYFGDEEGWHEAQAFARREQNPSLLKKHQGL